MPATSRRDRGRRVRLKAGAQHANACDKTIRNWIKAGLITGYRIGPKLLEVDLDEIDRIIRPVVLPVSLHPELKYDLANLRASHGTSCPCWCGCVANRSRSSGRRNMTVVKAPETAKPANDGQPVRQRELAAIEHHPQCACQGRMAPKDAIPHHPECRCALHATGSRCW